MSSIISEEEARDLLKKLNTKSKPNFKKISIELKVSRQTIENKFKVLSEEKIINNFTININPDLHPINLRYVFIEIKTNPMEPNLVENLLKIPQLITLDGIFGDFSLMAMFIFQSMVDFNLVLNSVDNIMAGSYFKKYQIVETIKVYKINGIELRSFRTSDNFMLDDIDYDILKILREEQGLKPISTYEIKKRLSAKYKEHEVKKKELSSKYMEHEEKKKECSQPTIHNRIKKLEKENIIVNYTITFSPKKIGFKGKFIVRIKPKNPARYGELAQKLMEEDEITDLFRIGEQYGLLAIVRVKTVENYANFIKKLYETKEIEDTFTTFVLDELIQHTNFKIN